MSPSPTHRPARRSLRTTRRLAVPALTAAIIALVPIPTAHAADSTTCTGSSTVTYSPGLTFTPRTVTYNEAETLTSCLSTDATLTAGASTNTTTLPGASCLGAGPGSGTYTITWNNGHTSVLTLTYTDVIAAGVETVIGTGTVTAGQFTGGTALVTTVLTAPDPLQCLTTTGVTSQTGIVTAQITTL
ncbi:hypothetical protein [Embleya sp. MST-111070]|uniref:hypothetical protein n=1 Tax=Embleya sp. MST-111070 TaxID=3398231 RepID=UPI003F737809